MAGIITDSDDSTKFDSHFIELLQPFELTHSATPAELRKWEEQFKAFFEHGKCYEQSLLVQNVLVGKFMDAELRSLMRIRAGNDTPVYGAARDSYKQKYPEQGSFMALLREYFALIHPSLTKRRVDFFKIAQRPGESFTSLVHRLEEAWHDAEMEAISKDTLRVIVAVAATTDWELLERFLKLDEPTMEDLYRIADNYEAMKILFPKRNPRRSRRSRRERQ